MSGHFVLCGVSGLVLGADGPWGFAALALERVKKALFKAFTASVPCIVQAL